MTSKKALVNFKKLAVSIASLFPVFTAKAFADDAPPQLDLSQWGAKLDVVIANILNVLIIVAVVMVMYAGIMYMFAAGDPGKIKQAQGTITWAVIGLVFVVVIKAIMLLVTEVIS